MSDIFLSYSGEDWSRVKPLADALSAHGWSVWWDRQIPAGTTFDQVIAEALADARCVVVVWSRNSIASSWVREEADEGRKRGVLIPVLVDEVSPPLGFGRIQAASMAGWNGAPESDAFRKLIGDIARIIGDPPGRASALKSIAPITPGNPADAAQPVLPRPEMRPGASLARQRRVVTVLLTITLVLALLLAIVVYRRGGGGVVPPADPVAGTTGLRLSAVLVDGGEPLTGGVVFDVFAAAQDVEGRRRRITGGSNRYDSAWFPVPPGHYFVTAAYENASTNVEVQVTPTGVTRRILNLRAGILRLTTVLADRTEALSGVAYEIYAAARDVEGRRKRVTGSNHQYAAARFLIPAGRYVVEATYGNALASMEVEVAAGADTQQILNLRAGILRLTAVLAESGKPPEGGVTYEVYSAVRDVEGNRKRVTAGNQSSGPARFVLPAGRYFMTAAHSGGSASAEVTITAGGVRDVQLRLVSVTKR